MYKITLDIEKLPEGPYLGTSPDLPGLVVQGDSVQEVLGLAPGVAHDLIVSADPRRKLENLKPRPSYLLSDPEDLVHLDWSIRGPATS